ncbi:MAG TPA: nucleotidyltransferase family protein [Nitrosopumilaceae archaeon]|nr:nucleotidyltransferase family protein [Nitrosopumilaceae archaeon]
MKVIILSGGIGKRLKPITDHVPKPLVTLNNIPIIEWQIRYFKKFGINEFVVCAGYKSDQIINYLKPKKNEVKIDYSIEKTSLGTGGAIKNASDFIDDENFFVINGDVITNLDPIKLKTNPNSIAVIPLKTSFGILTLNKNKVKRFEEKPEISDHWMNAGIYYLSKEILKHLPKKGSMENITFPILASLGSLFAVKYEKSFWYSIDSHKDIEECEIKMRSLNYEKFISKK